MPEGRHGYSDKFKPSYYGLRAFGWNWGAYQLLEYRGNVRPRPLLVIFNSSSAFGSKLHPGASTCCCFCCIYNNSGSCGSHFHPVLVVISVPTHLSASRDAGVQGRVPQFVSTGMLMSVNILCGLSYDAASVRVMNVTGFTPETVFCIYLLFNKTVSTQVIIQLGHYCELVCTVHATVVHLYYTNKCTLI